jgi:hypothetical protein
MPVTKSDAKRADASARKERMAKGKSIRTANARFEVCLKDFDARMADLTSRQNTLMRKVGIEPCAGLSDVR